ncbi:MAG: 4-hydroxy-2-oxovalerate aldolase [Rickettsiaceae bacterium]
MIKVLDTTLRDGSYAINFSFTEVETKIIAQGLDEAGVDLIEVGHGIGIGATRKQITPAIISDEKYAKATAESVKHGEWGMFCIPGIAELPDMDSCIDYDMDFIRIGVNVDNIEKSKIYIEKAKKHNMQVAVNFMKSHTILPLKFVELVGKVREFGADIVYLVDSAGSMFPKDIENYCKAVKAELDITLGFHGHNNLGFANANSVVAIEHGAEIIDTSLQGIGRSTGNAITEQFVCFLKRENSRNDINLIKLMDIAEQYIKPKLSEVGLDSLDIICGLAGFHSSYINIIQKYASQYVVDPRALIISVCKENQLDAPEDLVERKAKELKVKKRLVAKQQVSLKQYFGNEQTYK